MIKSESVIAQSYPSLCILMDYSSSASSIHEIFQAIFQEWVDIAFSKRSSPLGIKPGSLALQADSLLSESPGKFTIKSEHK